MGDGEYFAQRERIERERAASATNAVVRAIHLEFAGRYAELVALAAREEQPKGLEEEARLQA